MASDHVSIAKFVFGGNQTEAGSTPIEVWLSTLFNSTAISNDTPVAVYFSLLICSSIFLIATLLIGIVQFIHVYKYISVIRVKNNMYFLIFLHPISSICCVFGMTSPRNAAFIYGVILTYHMLAIRIAMDVMFCINGGRVTLSKYLTKNNEKIRFNFIPFCLLPNRIFTFLCTFSPTVENILRFEMIISQTCIVRIVLQIVDICVHREIATLNHAWFFVSHLVSIVSMMIALYSYQAITGVNKENSKKFRFHHIFMMVDWSQVILSYQKLGFDVLSSNDLTISRSSQLLTALHAAESIYLLFFLFSFEVLLMNILISYLLRPSKTYMFDKYTGTRSAPPPTYMYLDDSDEGLLPAMMESDSAHPPSNPSNPSQVQVQDAQPSSMDPSPSQQQQPESQESQMKDPKEGVTITAGPQTIQKLAEVTTPEEKKIPVEGGVEDDGAYENLKSQSVRSMNKMLQDEAADDFFKLPTPKKEDVTLKSDKS